MKKTFLLLLTVTTLFNCSTDDVSEQPENIPEATILGRWVLEGFEETIRYEFTEDKRFAIYGEDGIFPTLEEFNQENPQLTGLDWYYEESIIVVDLNFGNYSRLTPEFICDNYVVQWYDEAGEPAGRYFREGFDLTTCN